VDGSSVERDRPDRVSVGNEVREIRLAADRDDGRAPGEREPERDPNAVGARDPNRDDEPERRDDRGHARLASEEKSGGERPRPEIGR